MEWLLPLVLGALALFYICQPLWAGEAAARRAAPSESWHSLDQLEIDRQLGKIDDAEFEELQQRVPVTTPVPAPADMNAIEALIYGARREKRLQVSLESEILIARARRRRR